MSKICTALGGGQVRPLQFRVLAAFKMGSPARQFPLSEKVAFGQRPLAVRTYVFAMRSSPQSQTSGDDLSTSLGLHSYPLIFFS